MEIARIFYEKFFNQNYYRVDLLNPTITGAELAGKWRLQRDISRVVNALRTKLK